jgi:hypothetical protein
MIFKQQNAMTAPTISFLVGVNSIARDTVDGRCCPGSTLATTEVSL